MTGFWIRLHHNHTSCLKYLKSPGPNLSEMICTNFISLVLRLVFVTKWDKVFKSGLNKFFGRQPLKNLFSVLLNTLPQIIVCIRILNLLQKHPPLLLAKPPPLKSVNFPSPHFLGNPPRYWFFVDSPPPKNWIFQWTQKY